MKTLKLVQIGDSIGVVLPPALLARLEVAAGDELFLSDTPHGFRLTKIDPEFERQMMLAREVMKKRRPVLAELATSTT